MKQLLTILLTLPISIFLILCIIKKDYKGSLYSDNLNVYKFYINQGGNISDGDLLIAARAGSESIIEYLLNNDISINSVDSEGNNPLQIAISNNNKSLIKFLIYRGADLNNLNGHRDSPLIIAAYEAFYSEDYEITNLLVENGASLKYALNKAEKISDDRIKVVLFKYLNSENYIKVRGKIIESDLFIAVNSGSESTLKFLLDSGISVNSERHSGGTPIHDAVRKNNISMLKLLISYGADLNNLDENGNSPLITAASNAYYNDEYDIINLLVENKANVLEAVKISKEKNRDNILKILMKYYKENS